MPPARVPPQLTVGPFTTRDAATYGVTVHMLQGDEWRHLFRDVWIHKDIPDSLSVRVSAARLVMSSNAFLCGHTAAWVYGIDASDPRSNLVWVGYPSGIRARARAGCLVRELAVTPGDVQLTAGIATTTPLRTAFDCGRWLDLIEAVVVADHLAHVGFISPATLRDYAATHRGVRGIAQVDRVVDLLEPKTESPMETRLRLLLVFAGLDGFEPQYEIKVGRRFYGRADFAYVEERVIVEYDGADHWKQRRADDRRRDAMRDLGWTVIVVSAEDYYKTPEDVVARVRYQLAKARASR